MLNDMVNKQKKVTKTRWHNALLTLNFLNANEKRKIAVEKHWILGKTMELNQPEYFKDVLTFEWEPEYVLCWGRVLLLLPKEKKSYRYHQNR